MASSGLSSLRRRIERGAKIRHGRPLEHRRQQRRRLHLAGEARVPQVDRARARRPRRGARRRARRGVVTAVAVGAGAGAPASPPPRLRRTTSYRKRVSSFAWRPRLSWIDTSARSGQVRRAARGRTPGSTVSSRSLGDAPLDARRELGHAPSRPAPGELDRGVERRQQRQAAHVADEERAAGREDARRPARARAPGSRRRGSTGSTELRTTVSNDRRASRRDRRRGRSRSVDVRERPARRAAPRWGAARRARSRRRCTLHARRDAEEEHARAAPDLRARAEAARARMRATVWSTHSRISARGSARRCSCCSSRRR